jgi:hypothetical protein
MFMRTLYKILVLPFIFLGLLLTTAVVQAQSSEQPTLYDRSVNTIKNMFSQLRTKGAETMDGLRACSKDECDCERMSWNDRKSCYKKPMSAASIDDKTPRIELCACDQKECTYMGGMWVLPNLCYKVSTEAEYRDAETISQCESLMPPGVWGNDSDVDCKQP